MTSSNPHFLIPSLFTFPLSCLNGGLSTPYHCQTSSFSYIYVSLYSFSVLPFLSSLADFVTWVWYALKMLSLPIGITSPFYGALVVVGWLPWASFFTEQIYDLPLSQREVWTFSLLPLYSCVAPGSASWRRARFWVCSLWVCSGESLTFGSSRTRTISLSIFCAICLPLPTKYLHRSLHYWTKRVVLTYRRPQTTYEVSTLYKEKASPWK